jgi:uncharacterized protein with NRDE domain
MCLIIFDWQPDSERMLTLASNRDEFYARPSQDAHFWPDYPQIFGGRDLKMKGTWLAVSSYGRLAAVTNYRSIDKNSYRLSRGEIPHHFLSSNLDAVEYSQSLAGQNYAGFNALLFDGKQLVYCHNHETSKNNYQILTPGQYGLSNHLLDTEWPKVVKTKPALKKAAQLKGKTEVNEILLQVLSDQEQAKDDALPDTGIGLELEQLLSPPFITSPSYGTRTSTIIILEKDKVSSSRFHIHERQHQIKPIEYQDNIYSVAIIDRPS